MTNEKASHAFSKARSDMLLSKNFFFFGRLSLFLDPVQVNNHPVVKTLATDGRKIFYDVNFFMGLAPDVRKAAIAHEVMHCATRTFARRGLRDGKKWNRATDYAINLVLEEGGLRLGEGWLINPMFKGMMAEEIYDMLPDEDGSGGAPGCEGMTDDAFDEAMDGNAGGQDEGMTKAEMDKLDGEWKVNTAQAAFEAERQGKLPSNMKREIDEIFQNKVPWRDELYMFFNQRAKDDYSWMRPNKMFAHTGIILPGMYSERMGPIDVVIDTSGSITPQTLAEFGAEIRAIHSLLKPERTRVIYADAAVNHVDTFTPDEEVTFNMHGGGGTDFRPAIQHAADHEPPVALVYLTDMYGSFPETPPDFPVLWAATSKVVGPFGKTIQLD